MRCDEWKMDIHTSKWISYKRINAYKVTCMYVFTPLLYHWNKALCDNCYSDHWPAHQIEKSPQQWEDTERGMFTHTYIQAHIQLEIELSLQFSNLKTDTWIYVRLKMPVCVCVCMFLCRYDHCQGHAERPDNFVAQFV